ncbi:hypothetical protein [Cellulomonas sp. 73-92]|uniref:hypothetical protein n=1 Tax=Cellulomonas sp. 73-92 TaxID=1895740 RepID=UPI000B3080D5|nr:hypothetical protein [Cellulomonas sp. 73-92]
MRNGVVLMDSGGRYIDSGVIQISLTNAIIIVAMIVVFALAILLPFPGRGRRGGRGGDS